MCGFWIHLWFFLKYNFILMNSIFLPSVLILQSVQVVEWKYLKKISKHNRCNCVVSGMWNIKDVHLHMLTCDVWVLEKTTELMHGPTTLGGIEGEDDFWNSIHINISRSKVIHLHYTFWSPAIHKGSLCHVHPTLALCPVRAPPPIKNYLATLLHWSYL